MSDFFRSCDNCGAFKNTDPEDLMPVGWITIRILRGPDNVTDFFLCEPCSEEFLDITELGLQEPGRRLE